MSTTNHDKAAADWARIIPFLRPIEALINDPDVTDIMVNGDNGIFYEKDGRLHCLDGITIQETALQVAARNIARSLGDDINEESPLLDSRLPDGSRVAVVLWPISVTGTALAIRKIQSKRYNADELVRRGLLTMEMLQTLRLAVEGHKNILISGGTGTGKTTLLNALTEFIPNEERLVVIEDTSEIQIAKRNLVRFEARTQQPGLSPISIRQLLRTALRMRPDRILLGEVRDSEAFDLVQALNTGHAGSLSTIHADSAILSLNRLANCAMMSGIELPHRVIRADIADAIHYLVHLKRVNGRRVLTEMLQVTGYVKDHDRYEFTAPCDQSV